MWACQSSASNIIIATDPARSGRVVVAWYNGRKAVSACVQCKFKAPLGGGIGKRSNQMDQKLTVALGVWPAIVVSINGSTGANLGI